MVTPSTEWRLLGTQSQFTPLCNGRNGWLVRPPHGVTADQVLDPCFWANVALQLTPGDLIEAYAPDGTFDLDLSVIEVDTASPPAWARVRVLRAFPETDTFHVGLESQPMRFVDRPGLPDLAVKWSKEKGNRWVVFRPSDDAVIAAGFRSERDALAAIQPQAA